MARAWVGTSGFMYKHWRADLYPRGLAQDRWFAHYVERFDTVELNVTFYRLPAPSAFEGWARVAPADFAFVLKGSRFLTHIKRLKDGAGLALLFERAAPLGDRLAGVLWQLPPRWPADVERLRGFLEAIEALPAARAVRHAFEFRDASWFTPDVFGLLRAFAAEPVLADAPFQVLPPRKKARPLGKPEVRVPEPGRFAYMRRHGPKGGHEGGYPDALIAADGAWARGWVREGKDAFVYYNNDLGGHAWRNARALAGKLGVGPRPEQQELSQRRAR